jgi:small subunit ribosomal protein S17
MVGEMASENDGESESAEPGAPRRQRQEQVGVVVSAKMQKTVVVAVERLVRHAMYRKTIRRTSSFMAHDEKGARKGDTVRIVETRPLSKHKRWRVEEIVSRSGGAELDEPTAEAAAQGRP